MLRRTARAKARKLSAELAKTNKWHVHPTHEYRVLRMDRGPWRYRVVWALKT